MSQYEPIIIESDEALDHFETSFALAVKREVQALVARSEHPGKGCVDIPELNFHCFNQALLPER